MSDVLASISFDVTVDENGEYQEHVDIIDGAGGVCITSAIATILVELEEKLSTPIDELLENIKLITNIRKSMTDMTDYIKIKGA